MVTRRDNPAIAKLKRASTARTGFAVPEVAAVADADKLATAVNRNAPAVPIPNRAATTMDATITTYSLLHLTVAQPHRQVLERRELVRSIAADGLWWRTVTA